MAITLTTAARNAAADAIVDLIDAGSSDSTGDIVIMTSGDVEVATLAMSNPAFGDADTGVATADTITNDSDATGGVAAKFKVQDRDNTEVFQGTVATSGADMNLSSTTIAAGEIVSITSMTLTVPATAS